MPISAEQWRAVVGSNSVRRPCQVDAKHVLMEQLLFGEMKQTKYCVEYPVSEQRSRLHSIQERSDEPCLSDYCAGLSEGSLVSVLVLVSVCVTCAESVLLSHSIVTMLLLLLAGDVETNPGPTGTDTPEYQTLRKCTGQLKSLIKHDLSTISDHLWSQGLMSEDLREDLSEDNKGKAEKATLVLNYITMRVKNTPDNFDKFVKILKKLGQWARDTVELLQETYCEQCKAAMSQSATATPKAKEQASVPPVVGRPVKLGEQHLEPIKAIIWEARVQWKNIGGGLGISHATLDEIRRNHHYYDDGDRLEAVLRKWFHTDKAIIQDLLKVLKGKIVHRVDIANKITALRNEKDKIAVGLMASQEPADEGLSESASTANFSQKKLSASVQAENLHPPVQATDPEENGSGNVAPTTSNEPHSELVIGDKGPQSDDQEDFQQFCTSPPLLVQDKYSRQCSEDYVDTDAAHAQVAPGKLWPSSTQLVYVYFLNPEKWNDIDSQPATIMAWATKWETHDNYGIVPRFRRTNDVKQAHIRVKFGNSSWSRVGTDAFLVDDLNSPTMMLGLQKGKEDFNRHTVIHEFGHALGLEHEHQRSCFWNIARDLIDIEAMEKDVGGNNEYCEYTLHDYDDIDGSGYDPDSIMHYWFDKKWLKKPEHRNKAKVLKLPDSALKKVLLGIHTRHKNLASFPSATDFSFLQKCYNERDSSEDSSTKSSVAGGPQNVGRIKASSTGSSGTVGNPQSPIPSLSDTLSGPLNTAFEESSSELLENIDIPPSQSSGVWPSAKPFLITKEVSAEDPSLQEKDFATTTVKIGIIGATNSGKSTTINALLGRKFLPASSGSTTAQVLCIKHDPSTLDGELYDVTSDSNKLLASGMKAIYNQLDKQNKLRRANSDTLSLKLLLRVRIPFLCSLAHKANIEFYDTPGTSEDVDSQIYKDAKEIQDGMGRLILVLSQDTALLKETTDLLSRLRARFPQLTSSQGLYVLMNKSDLFFADDDQEPDDLKKNISDRLQINDEYITYYSAKLALKVRNWQDLESVDEEDLADFKSELKKLFPLTKKKVKELSTKKLTVLESFTQLCLIAEDTSCISEVETLLGQLLVSCSSCP